jgi:hypothetical protein
MRFRGPLLNINRVKMTSKGQPTLILYYTCTSDLNPRLGEKDTARVTVETITNCQLIDYYLTNVGKKSLN